MDFAHAHTHIHSSGYQFTFKSDLFFQIKAITVSGEMLLEAEVEAMLLLKGSALNKEILQAICLMRSDC